MLDNFVLEDRYDLAGDNKILYVGDGKNLYRLAVNDGFYSNALPDGFDEVKADCVGVCDPETYQRIIENEDDGFNSVLDYIDGEYSKAFGYHPEQGFLYHQDSGEETDIREDFHSNTQAQKAVEQVLED